MLEVLDNELRKAVSGPFLSPWQTSMDDERTVTTMDLSSLGPTISSDQFQEFRQKLLQKLAPHLHRDLLDSLPISCRIKPLKQSLQFEEAWLLRSGTLIAYMENYNRMIATTAGLICPFLKEREPWQDFDVCIFDQDMTWCVAITHNDQMKYISFI